MSITTLPHQHPSTHHDLGSRGTRRLSELWFDVWDAVWTALWVTGSHTRVLTARLIGWVAAERHRIHAATAGVVVSVATGIVIGAATGALATRVVHVLLGFVQNP